jgi:hypothetical protein
VSILVEERFRSSRNVQEMNSQKCDDESTKKRQGVRGICRIKTLEKDEGGNDGGCRKPDIIHRIYAVILVSGRIENVGETGLHIGGECV